LPYRTNIPDLYPGISPGVEEDSIDATGDRPQGKLVTKYGLSESAFQNKSSGSVHISALNSVMLLFAQPRRRHKIEKNRSAKVVT